MTTLGNRAGPDRITAPPRPPLHVAFVLAGLGAGGAERVISLIAGDWTARNWAVTIVAFDSPDAPIFHAFDPRIGILRLDVPAGGAGGAWRRVNALRRALDRLDPEVTIAFLTKINVLTLLASLGRRRKVIVCERNNPLQQNANRLWRLALGRLHWRASAIVMQTRASLECLGPAARRRAIVISNPIVIHPVSAPPQTSKILAATGRLTSQKGFDLLIDAFAGIASRHPQWTLVISGEGNDRAALEAQIDRLDLATRVSLPGNSLSPDEWVGRADAFVLSSRYEGFGNALGEAMAGGLPVVSFDCDYGPAELISHDRDGLLVPNGDVPALATALDRLLGDAPLRARLGDAARATAERLHPRTIVAQWDRVLSLALPG